MRKSAGSILGEAIGIIMDRPNDNGSLDGHWTVSGQNGNGAERRTPQ